MNAEIKKLTEKSVKYSEKINTVIKEIEKVIVGQEDIIEKVMISLIAKGHVLLEGAPGLAKTLLVKTLSDTTNLAFKRIQFTPDLLPADILGTRIYNHKEASFTTQKGPIFANLVLADEINRAPPKVQSALLESMQEKQVTIGKESFNLDEPFFVLATQNPIETEGTYRLPEAQVDRFMFKLIVDYPNIKNSVEIIDRMTKNHVPSVKKIISDKDLTSIQLFAKEIYVDEKVTDYVARIVDATRNPKEYDLEELEEQIDYGASPRALIWLILGAKANALLNSRGFVKPEDVLHIAKDVLRHRILISYEAEAEDITSDMIIDKILSKVKMP
ncbi:ATPase [Candidatus Woesearchaeota archaeon]|nr:MAG: ATPase [Candidatus Woesearchaeota archaeon]